MKNVYHNHEDNIFHVPIQAQQSQQGQDINKNFDKKNMYHCHIHYRPNKYQYIVDNHLVLQLHQLLLLEKLWQFLVKKLMPIKQLKMIQAWCVIHEDELLLNFETLRSNPASWEKVEPLK